MDIMTNLTRAAEILASYSDGRLPRPASISLGTTFISFNMTEARDVIRWSESADVPVESTLTKANEITGQRYRQTNATFYHDGMVVYVSHNIQSDEMDPHDEGSTYCTSQPVHEHR